MLCHEEGTFRILSTLVSRACVHELGPLERSFCCSREPPAHCLNWPYVNSPSAAFVVHAELFVRVFLDSGVLVVASHCGLLLLYCLALSNGIDMHGRESNLHGSSCSFTERALSRIPTTILSRIFSSLNSRYPQYSTKL